MVGKLSPSMSPCHLASGKGASKEEVLGCLPPESCIPSYHSPPVPCGNQKRICSDMGAERRSGMGKQWACEQKEAKGSSLDFGLWVINQEWCFGSSLWSFGLSFLLLQRRYQARKLIKRHSLWGYSHLHRHLALLTHPVLCKNVLWIMESCGLEGISGSYPVPTPCSNHVS